MGLILRFPPWARAFLLLVVAAGYSGMQMMAMFRAAAVGIDFVPLRHAAISLTQGASVYTDRDFVYPPTAAVVLLPLAFGTDTASFRGWALVCAAALALSIRLICRATPPVFAIAGVLALFGSAVSYRSLFLGNMSELLVPFAVGTLLAFRRDRWMLGCALLAVSLLLKPMLVPLIAVPVLHRRWRELASTFGPAFLVLMAGVLFVPGGRRLPAVLRYCLHGTNLHGRNAHNNLSLRGWAENTHTPAAIALAGSACVVAAVAYSVFLSPVRPDPVRLGSLLLIATFLAGSIAEVHFLLTALAVVLLYLTSRPPSWPFFVPGLAVLGLPAVYASMLGLPANGQSWLIAGELLLFGALLAPPIVIPAVARLRLPAAV